MDPYAFYSNASDANPCDTDGSSSKLWGMVRRNDSTSGVLPVKTGRHFQAQASCRGRE